MGDRANVRLIDGPKDGPAVYFYTHWAGTNLPELVRRGLQRGKLHWGDTPYLNRIIFDTLTGCDGGEAGFGIDTQVGDGAGRVLVVDHGGSRVYREGYEGNAVSFDAYVGDPGVSWSTLGGE